MNYQIEKKLNEMKDQESYYSNAAKALKAITRNFKKNGEPFQNMKQNFNNCSIRIDPYANTNDGKKLTVYFQSRKGYEGYSFDLYEIVNARTMRLYNADEVAEIIAKRIKQCEEYAVEYAEKIANIKEMESTMEKIREMVVNSPYCYELADILRKSVIY